ncbi:MAG: hypothetical protein GF401_04465 [Chitinivibrionales bacterium]|nr:hypothetical protein [Chitinivibrionales bacterium]
MKYFCWPLFLTLVICFSSFAARFAVLAGNSEAGDSYESLKYVNNDLQEFQSILNDYCGFKKQNIIMLHNSSPKELLQSISSFQEKWDSASEEHLFLFYYSGHATHDSLLMGEKRLAMTDLKRRLDQVPGTIRIAILDACQSGGFTRTKGGKLAEPFLFKEDGKVKGQVILYSSSANEHSQESDYYRNSIFTFHFLNALRGCADLSQDGKITLNEAYHYSYNHTIASTVKSSVGIQHPGYQFKIQGEGDIILADLNIRTQGIILEEGVAGPVTILDKNRTIVADLTKEAGSRFMIALNPGTYQVVNRSGSSKRLAAVTIKEKKTHSIRPAHFRHVKPTRSTAKGDRQTNLVFSLIGLFGYQFTDFAPLVDDLNHAFGNYSTFGISPRFYFPMGLYRPSMSAELLFANGIYTRFGAAYMWDSDKDTYFSSKANPFDNNLYSYSLTTETDLALTAVEIGSGYRFTSGLLKDISFHAGLTFMYIDFVCSSTFSDQLYNVVQSGKQKETGTLVLPFLAVAYEYSLSPFTHIGTEIRYKYQDSAETIDKNSPTPFTYDFGGFDMSLMIRVPFIHNTLRK